MSTEIWTPSIATLTRTDELISWSFDITFFLEYDGTAGSGVPGSTENATVTMTREYPVIVTALEDNSTLTVEDNKIYGFYSDAFLNKEVQHQTRTQDYINTIRFNEIVVPNLKEMIYYHADPAITKTFYYRADAWDNDPLSPTYEDIIATKTYNIIVTNNWTPGQQALIYYVGLSRTNNTAIANKQLPLQWHIKWENSSSSEVVFENNSGTSSVKWDNNL